MFYGAICQAGAETPAQGWLPSAGMGGGTTQLEVTLCRWGTRVGQPRGQAGWVTHTESPCSALPLRFGRVAGKRHPKHTLLEQGPWQGKGLFKLLISFVFKHGLRAASAAEGIVIKRQPSGRQAMCAQQSPQRLAAR